MEATMRGMSEQPDIHHVTRYRVREPIFVDAVQWTGDNEEVIAAFVGEVTSSSVQVGFKTWDQPGFTVIRSTVDENFIAQLWNSAQGDWMSVPIGCYVVRGVTGHFFAVAAEDFTAIYEPVAAKPATAP